MAANVTVGNQIKLAMEEYSRNHTQVRFTSLFNAETWPA
jgi:hypothetical protein